jgi:hypothetical protein
MSQSVHGLQCVAATLEGSGHLVGQRLGGIDVDHGGPQPGVELDGAGLEPGPQRRFQLPPTPDQNPRRQGGNGKAAQGRQQRAMSLLEWQSPRQQAGKLQIQPPGASPQQHPGENGVGDRRVGRRAPDYRP